MREPHLIERDGAFLADNCTVVGDVTLGKNVSVWYGTVIRGDVAAIRIGANTNVQDLTMIHPQHDQDVEIGENVTIGHAAVVHCSKIGDGCLIGIKAILLPGSEIGANSIIAAGALVPLGVKIPPRSLVVGMPGRVVRQVTDEEIEGLRDSAERYVTYARRHLED
ncbi:MAG: carbonic anhydrase/acetyltransferase-like protein (isoleucine patch superfamily) [Planctomycetota bacterium]|jgi:carbonic anhydrase/acetyltransferase-like protein (isoleucine patch superfamily)